MGGRTSPLTQSPTTAAIDDIEDLSGEPDDVILIDTDDEMINPDDENVTRKGTNTQSNSAQRMPKLESQK